MVRDDRNDDADPRTSGPPRPRLEVGPGPGPMSIWFVLGPPLTLTGRVTYGDTGRPVPHALIAVGPDRRAADGEGRFSTTVPPTLTNLPRYPIHARSPVGPPYLIASQPIGWPDGAAEHSVEIALTRGVAVRGQVVEDGTGRPVAGAIVRIVPDGSRSGPPAGRDVPSSTGADGTYLIAAPPGPGHLVVQGPDDDYVLVELGGKGGSLQAEPGRPRYYAHAYRAVDLKPRGPDLDVEPVRLRRGAAIHGRVLDPDGRPVRHAAIFSRLNMRVWTTGGGKLCLGSADGGQGRESDGRFALHGLDPGSDAEVPAYFLEPERMLGATARFSARSAASGPVTVRLEPCGTPRARRVGPDGKPLERYPAGGLVRMVVTPGPPFRLRPKEDLPYADEGPLFQLDRRNYGTGPASDARGVVAFPALIPGASYRIVDNTPTSGGGDPEVRKEFTVKPGETLELGDILIARPRRRN